MRAFCALCGETTEHCVDCGECAGCTCVCPDDFDSLATDLEGSSPVSEGEPGEDDDP